jgi:hypothetical protein
MYVGPCHYILTCRRIYHRSGCIINEELSNFASSYPVRWMMSSGMSPQIPGNKRRSLRGQYMGFLIGMELPRMYFEIVLFNDRVPKSKSSYPFNAAHPGLQWIS